jgi:hypothetical protein
MDMLIPTISDGCTNHDVIYSAVDWNSVVGIATRYILGGQGIESR